MRIYFTSVLCVLLLVQYPAMAGPLAKMEVSQSTIDVVIVTNANKRCHAESHLRNLGGFGYAVNGCAFWINTQQGRQCTIYLESDAPPDLLGHEVLHCFSGAYHK